MIYELLDDAKLEMEKLLPDEVVETPVGELEIKGIFRTTKTEIIAGGLVTSGKMVPDVLARALRKNEVVAELEVASVQREKNEVKEVFEGEMCGLDLKIPRGQGKFMLEIGDKLECFTRELKKRTL